MSPPPTLTTLPEELIDQILTFLPPPTLHALTLVSRDINRITTPHLYASITLTSTSFTHLRPLAFLLWTSPAHANLVRAFSVRRAYGGNLDPWPKHSEGEGGLLESVIKEMVSRYVRGGEEEREEWVRRVREGGDALVIASLLLRSLPGVREMVFDGFMLVDPAVR
ncbi:Nn.00g084250.m01.CDS01 [Neocucurbitaria sp. VM-36]